MGTEAGFPAETLILMEFAYTVTHSRRKKIALIVERDGSIVVRAPLHTSEEAIRQAVESRKFWLYQKTRHPLKYPLEPVRKEFVTGESLLYLGRHYRLEVVDEPLEGIVFSAGFRISRRQRSEAGTLLKAWYITQARKRFTRRADYFAKSLGVAYNEVKVVEMRFRWGSCTPNNHLNFNWRLIKAPSFVVDYLIVHELAHLRVANHTPEFWNVVAVQIPEYLKAREWLLKNGNLLEVEL